MRIVFGQGGREAEAHLELALAEFRTLGERFGISLALSELAGQLPCVVSSPKPASTTTRRSRSLTEVGAVEDVIEVRTQQALLYWLNGDREASAATIAEAERSAEGVTWPYALVNLALAKAELARLGGDTAEARRQLGLATTLLGDAAEQPVLRAEIHNLLGYLAEDLQESRNHRVAAWQAASEAGAPIVIAQVLVGVADLAAAPRPVRAGCALARCQRRRTRTAGSLPPGCGQDRAGRAASPRRSTVRRGDTGGHAGELVRAGRGHARLVSGRLVSGSARCAVNDDVAVPGAGVDRDRGVGRGRAVLRRDGVAHRPSLAA